MLTINQLTLISLLLRICLIIYGEIHDVKSLVKYTDVDYKVFSDAALHISNGDSPYRRLTYRYTPLLAILLQPNVTIPWFGKLLFTFADLIIGYLTYKLLSSSHLPNKVCIAGAAMWLLNPLSAGVSTRGNAESLLGCVVLLAVYLVKQEHPSLAGLALSLAVHLKLYPVIYSLPMFLHLAYCSSDSRRFINFSTIKFVAAFLVLQGFLLSVFYHVYGYEFVFETYLYHFIRSDTRHNFSPYFYLMYLEKYAVHTGLLSGLLKFLSFLPQALLQALFSLKYYSQLEVCLTLQTITFVIFNKVSTSQYFLWYLWLIPLAYPCFDISLKRAVALTLIWFAGQGAWLATGYLIEFQCLNYFLSMHFASLFFLLSQCYITCVLVRSVK